MTLFLRLLKTDIPAKGETLAAQIAAVNTGQPAPETFTIAPTDFSQIPGSPFAYWASREIVRVFAESQPLESNGRVARRGPSSGDDFRRVRVWWEVSPSAIDRNVRWVPFAKGGAFSPFYFDFVLLVDWDEQRFTFRDFYGRPGREISKLESSGYFFKPGITYISRTMQQFCARILPRGCVFAHISPAIFVPYEHDLFSTVAILNSTVVDRLLSMSLSRGGESSAQTKAYEVGQIQLLPFPETSIIPPSLEKLAHQAYDLSRRLDTSQEPSHAFCLPATAQNRAGTLDAASQRTQAQNDTTHTQLAKTQAEIDSIVAALYGLDIDEIDQLGIEKIQSANADDVNMGEADEEGDDVVEEEEMLSANDILAETQNFLMWCLGCAFGRWDVRFALDPTLLPKLQGPFDPLPRCSPGMLVGPEGLPATSGNIVSEAWLRARPSVITLPEPSTLDALPSTILDSVYPLRIDWDGIVPDDDDHPDDIVRRVREVLDLLWGDRAEAIEHEACQILGVASLRDYFRQPKAFFDFHIKRYSKSRRKAPIYWLLQSAKKNYGLWLYYHRLDPDTLFKALTLYADPKLNRERVRLADLRATLDPGGPARDRRALEKAIAKQESLLNELTDFRNELERIARLGLPPDFNDGVIISIAPLHPLVPWKEAAKMWAELTAGIYGWATMSQKMRQRRLVKGAGN